MRRLSLVVVVVVTMVVLSLASLRSIDAVFADEMGVADWHRHGLGEVTHARLDKKGAAGLVVATEQGVIAALDAATGELRWRQRLSPASPSSSDERVLLLDLSSPPRGSRLAVASGPSGRRLTLWDAEIGSLQWDLAAWNSSAASDEAIVSLQLLSDLDKDGEPELLVAAQRSGVALRSGKTGKVLWRAALPSGLRLSHVGNPSQGAVPILAADVSLQQPSLFSLDPRSGALTGPIRLSGASSSQVLLLSRFFVAFSSDRASLVITPSTARSVAESLIHPFASIHPSSSSSSSSSFGEPTLIAVDPSVGVSSDSFILRFSAESHDFLFSISADGRSITRVHSFSRSHRLVFSQDPSLILSFPTLQPPTH
ncbi:MAG: PQQ-binding-like beta-propeller repeat protein, partial [archaeon]|nr:PQQ-binding-like beta-propeller repeat protein [archaeon]